MDEPIGIYVEWLLQLHSLMKMIKVTNSKENPKQIWRIPTTLIRWENLRFEHNIFLNVARTDSFPMSPL